jgi:Uma2 family endonuclease
MSVALKHIPPPAEEAKRSLYRFSVDQYHRMVEVGILDDNDRVELLRGWIVEKMPHNPPHDGSVGRVNRLFVRAVPEDWVVRSQSALTLADSEPEPDFAIVPAPDATYFKRHPVAKDVAVLMEVADSSLLDDRRWKGSLYAEARIPEYWIINLVQKQVEVYTVPRGGQYRKRKIYAIGDSVPLILGGRQIALSAVRELVSA